MVFLFRVDRAVPQFTEEESRRLLLLYRRLLFLRYRALFDGDLEGAITLSSEIERLESDLLLIKKLPASQKRLLDQCERWMDRSEHALCTLRRRADRMLFRERADEEIKNFLRKMFQDEA